MKHLKESKDSTHQAELQKLKDSFKTKEGEYRRTLQDTKEECSRWEQKVNHLSEELREKKKSHEEYATQHGDLIKKISDDYKRFEDEKKKQTSELESSLEELRDLFKSKDKSLEQLRAIIDC